MGTLSGGLARYDRDHDSFVRYAGGPNGLSGVSVNDIADDGARGVWVATAEGGLDHVVSEAGKIIQLRHSERDPDSLPDDHVDALLRSRVGTLWVGTLTGLVRRGPDDAAFVPVPLPTPRGEVAEVLALFEDSLQRLGCWHSLLHLDSWPFPRSSSIPIFPISEGFA